MSKWNSTTLGAIASFSTGRLDSNAAEEGGLYPFFTCSPETYRINSFAFDTEAVLLAGNNANAVYPLKYFKGKFNAYQRTYIIEPKSPELADCRYLYYLISYLLKQLKEVSVGSATKFLTKRILENFVIEAPPIKEQKAIAKILSAFDDKIELNRRMNATLEEMARAIFKAWFVDFEPVHANKEGRPSQSASPEIAKLFPSEFENGIPKGWQSVKLVDLCERITKGTTPKKFEGQGINFIKAESLTTDRGFLPEKFARIDDETNASLLRSQLRADDVLFSIAGTIGRIARVIPDILPANTNQALAIVRVDKNRIDPFFIELLLSGDEVQHSLIGKTVHAVQANLSLTVLGETKVVYPTRESMNKAFRVLNSIDDKIKANSREDELLRQLRDSLLPRLISGKIGVGEEERILEMEAI